MRDFNHVDDVVDALLIAAADDRAAGLAFNLGDKTVVTLKDLADQLIEANGGGSYEVHAFPEERKRIDIGDYYADYSKFAGLGWSPKVPLIEGLRRTLDYYRTHLDKYV